MRPPHPWLATIPAVEHGGRAEGLLDLSASLAPLGPSPRSLVAAREADVAGYPVPDAGPLVAAMAADLGVPPDRVVAGPGAADLLLRICLAHLRPGDRVLLVAPCFGEYARAAAACGAEVVSWWAPPEADVALDVASVAAAATAADAALGILARPASPTGIGVPVEDVSALVASTPRTTWVVDEAFLGLADDPQSVAGGQAVVVRSLTKELGLAGLRIAVADAPPETAAALRALTPPWAVSAPALAAAVAGLADTAHRTANRSAARRGREALTATFAAAGVATTAATANFVCARVGDVTEFSHALQRRGIAVRDCAGFGMPGWVRIAVPPPDRLEEVRDAVSAALGVAEVPR